MVPGAMQLAAAHGTTADGNDYGTVNTVGAGIWFHFAEVHDGATNTKRYYVNGASQGDRAVADTVGGLGVLLIGWDGFYGLVDMRIDNLRVYKRTLSPAEISQDMNAP